MKNPYTTDFSYTTLCLRPKVCRHWKGMGIIMKNPYTTDFSYTTLCLRPKVCRHWKGMGIIMINKYKYITLREEPTIKDTAASWFHSKWGVPKEAYLECMDSYLNMETEYGWYLCLDDNKIVAGLGVIENDFHNRKDLTPNICAVYTEEEYRCQGIAGNLLNMAVSDMKNKGITPVYLVTDHTGFYEKYGWEFLCMVQGDDEPEMTRMYIHK